MVEGLNYLQGRDEMVSEFKFFHGIKNKLTVSWRAENNDEDLFGLNVENELTRLLSQQIAEEIDNEIINELSRRINGGGPSVFEGPIERLNNNFDYLNHWLSIGNQRA